MFGITARTSSKSLLFGGLNLLVSIGISNLVLNQGWLTTAVTVFCSGCAAVAVFLGLLNRRKQTDLNLRFLTHFLAQLKQVSTPEERQQVLEQIVALSSLQGADLSGIDFSSANLKNVDMSGADLSATKHTVADLSEVNLKDANLSYANLRYVTLNCADMRRANLNGATLDSSDLHGVQLRGANLRAASLCDADLSESDLRHAILRHANLHNANLENANLSNADLTHCTLPDGSIWEPDTDLRKFTHPESSLTWDDRRPVSIWSRSLFNNLKK